MQTIVEVIRKTEAFLAKSGVEAPKIEAEWLLAETLGCKRLDLYLQHDRPLEEPVLDSLRDKVRRRGRGEPLQYIFGYLDFHEIRLQVKPGVLIPRPETELLVEKVLTRIGGLAAPRIVDLGTGSGAIALALATALPAARVLAVERSAEALALARTNAGRLGLRDRVAFRSGDWLDGLEMTADCIVSNPPYLTEAEWETARPEVKGMEPREALVAAEEGMADLRRILEAAPSRLTAGGLLALETGIAHGPALLDLAARVGFSQYVVEKDDNHRDRFFFAVK